MDEIRRILDLTEATSIPGESSYIAAMGDGTGTKRVKHKTLMEQLKKEIMGEGGTPIEEMTYEETMEFLNGTEGGEA